MVSFNAADIIEEDWEQPHDVSMPHRGRRDYRIHTGRLGGSGLPMTMYPIGAGFGKYPESGRDLKYTTGKSFWPDIG